MKKTLSFACMFLLATTISAPAFSQSSCTYCTQSWAAYNNILREQYNQANLWIAYEHLSEIQAVWPSAESIMTDPDIEDNIDQIKDLFTNTLPNMWSEFDQATSEWNASMDQNDSDLFNCIQGCTP